MDFKFVLILIVGMICWANSQDIIGHNICTDNQKRIPGSNLKTNTFYTLRLKRFLKTGVITWTNFNFASGARAVETDNSADSQYDKGGKLEYDAQWVFIQSPEYGWYSLVNRKLPGEYLGYSTNNTDLRLAQNKFHLLMDPNYYPSDSNDQYLWKPVLRRDSQTGEEFYLIKSRALPDAVVTWSDKKYRETGQFMQVDNTRDAQYNQGNQWYEDTLFSFKPE